MHNKPIIENREGMFCVRQRRIPFEKYQKRK